jgi:hypothetical protein
LILKPSLELAGAIVDPGNAAAPVRESRCYPGNLGHSFGLFHHELDMLKIRTQERVGSLISASGVVWASYAATQNFVGVWQFPPLPPGPLEVGAIGILVWLHAKWRRSLKN